MNWKTYKRNQSDLMSLLGKEQAASRGEGGQGDQTATQAHSEIESDEPCNDTGVILDISAMRDGNIDRAGVERISQHLGGCARCRVLVASIAVDAVAAEGTGKHTMAPATGRDDLGALSDDADGLRD